jgi:BRCT domain type II-containing protein
MQSASLFSKFLFCFFFFYVFFCRYAGEVAKSVAKKCTHALVGTEPGPSKMEQITERKLTIVNEDELFELIRTLPAKKTSKKFEDAKAKARKVATEGKEQPKEVIAAIRALPANSEQAGVKELWTTKLVSLFCD